MRLRLIAILVGLAAGVVPGTAGVAGEVAVRGPVEVVDGDTIRIDLTRVRLSDIDAPELGEKCIFPEWSLPGLAEFGPSAYSCGAASRNILASVALDEVVCRARNTDRYGRLVADCWVDVSVGEPPVRLDVGGWMVDTGYARAMDRRYEDAERKARLSGRGLWACDIVGPPGWEKHCP